MNPDQEEVSGNGIDDDCDGKVDEVCATFPIPVDDGVSLIPYFLLLLVPFVFSLGMRRRVQKARAIAGS